MTDRQHPPQRAGSPGSTSTYQSHDPEPAGEPEEKKFKLPVNVVQVSASAGAAVTSAVAASYFGVGGTLAGAAFGSVVSTVAGAFYTESLSKAHKVVATTTAVVVQRYPGDVSQADSIHRMTGPAGVPVADSLNRVGSEDGRRLDVEHVEVPIIDETQVMGRGYDQATQIMPPVRASDPRSANYSGAHDGFGRPDQRYRQTTGEQPTRRSERRQAELAGAEQSWWKKPGFLMAGISMAGFLIALAFILSLETAIDRPISGGEGNSLTKLTSSNTNSGSGDEEEEGTTPTESATATPSESVTPTESATPSATDSETVAPTESTAPEVTATSEPSDPATDSETGSDEVQPSDPATDEGAVQDGTADQGDTEVDGQTQEQVAP